VAGPPIPEAATDVDVAKILEFISQAPPEGDGAPEVVVEPPVWGAGLLRGLERGFLRLDRLLSRALPEDLNPFLHTGAIAVTSLLIATATGIVLLLWYRPSVHMAYLSVAAMSEAPWTAGLMRSLHRYSSDACMFFALVHALRILLERRIGGARWLAWVTGVAGVGVLWFTGWTGYWLVWDERAQQVAVGTARLLDVLPIFADPMGRSFLTDSGVNSLLFFVVFFIHMLIPLVIGLLLWLHIARLARSRFLTRRLMTIWVTVSLVLLSLVYPATSAEPARMTVLPQVFSMDWWYLLPLTLTDRLGGGALWATFLVSGVVLFSVPWWMARGRARPAAVEIRKCNACQKCFNDCPYDAITMIARTDDNRKFDLQANVNPDKCVGCGICAGSCDSAGVGLEWFAVTEQRRRLAVWLKQAADAGESPHVAFVCANSAGANLEVDSQTGRCEELPGYLVLTTPCAGWMHPFGAEHSLRFGGSGTLVVTCAPGSCRYREGAQWTQLRLTGQREPMLRTDKVAAEKVRLLALDRTRGDALLREARAFQAGQPAPAVASPSRALTGLAASLLAVVLMGVMGVVSDYAYASPKVHGSELVVTFKHPGAIEENCRELSEDELARRPVHMRKGKVCDRARSDVRLRVSVDGEQRVALTIPAGGIWGDGNSVAVERIPLDPGRHRVRAEIGDTADVDEWSYVSEETLEFTEQARRVLVFDRVSGFEWH
jgi:ferredoxin